MEMDDDSVFRVEKSRGASSSMQQYLASNGRAIAFGSYPGDTLMPIPIENIGTEGDQVLCAEQRIRSTSLPHEWPGVHFVDSDEVAAVTRVAQAASPFRFYGPDLQEETKKLEAEFAAYVGRKYALGVNSGTAALQIALASLGVGPGCEVILPGYFWVATVGAVVRSGAIPVLVDSDETWSLDPQKVEEKITSRTKVIITVHMGGVIGRVNELVAIAKKHGICLLEDCAQAVGASQHGVKAGSFGDIAIYSFQLNKHMTSGEGGMIVADNKTLYDRCMAVHDLGYPRNSEGRLITNEPESQMWGIGSRMSELTAAFARPQLKKLDRICAAMRGAKNVIRKAISPIDGLSLRTVLDPQGDAGSFLIVTCPTRAISLDFIKALHQEGIRGEQGGLYPIHMDDWGLHIYYNIPSLVNKRGTCPGVKSVWELAENRHSDQSYEKGACPRLDDMLDRSIIMSIASALADSDISDIVSAFTKAADKILGGKFD
jgi:8-amino-3,8-dideoxy-alpha-D-manno-octulosonate transaminase